MNFRAAPRRSAPARPLWVDSAFQLAVRCQGGGLADQAKQLYGRILLAWPEHPEALHNLALLAAQDREYVLAGELCARAVRLQPANPLFHSSYGNVLAMAGQAVQAHAEYLRALELDPRCVDALYNRGNLLRTEGAFREAIDLFRRALAIEPHPRDTSNNLGNVYLAAGESAAAAECFTKAMREQPDDFKAYANLANLHSARGEWEQAESLLRRALHLAPWQACLHHNLGKVLASANRLGPALACFQEAVRLDPGAADLHISLGGVYGMQGRFEEALACYQRGLALEPKFAAAHEVALFTLHYSPALEPPALAAEHRRWAERHAEPLGQPARRFANSPDPERRIRVGYVSADLHHHPIAYFLTPVLAARDRQRTEVFCYACGKVDGWTERILACQPVWKPVGSLGDAELARQIEEDQIDILVDLSGHTAGNRLLVFARKPAPVQVSWLGYFNTTGMRAMDYLIVDPELAPPREPAPFVEEALRLPGCYLTYAIPDYAPAVAPAPALQNGYVTYGCFNSLSKIGLHVVSVWAEILRRTPASRLVMKNYAFADETSRRLYEDYFAQCGIEPARVNLLGPSPHGAVLEHYAEVDIALDPFPYNGGTTTCEALAMGVPVVTLRGDRFVSRVGATILRNAGLDSLIAGSESEYIEKALVLAAQPELAAEMRTGMRARLARSTLCDCTGFTRKLEHAYRDIWRRWCALQSGA
jgi:predicted O-linked N-acetylglucosamine transferase (SPINDLY family)